MEVIEIKRSSFAILFLVLIIITACIIKSYPTSMKELYGNTLEITDGAEINIGHAPTINDPMIYKGITNNENIKGAIDYLSSLKFLKVPSSSFKKFSNLEAYQLTIKDNNGELLNVCIRGNKHLFITDKNENVTAYVLLDDTFNLYYFESLYACGK